MIEFRSLTEEEQRNSRHFCGRCETWQVRGELHHCVATERYKRARSAGVRVNIDPPVSLRETVNTAKNVYAVTVPAVTVTPNRNEAPASVTPPVETVTRSVTAVTEDEPQPLTNAERQKRWRDAHKRRSK